MMLTKPGRFFRFWAWVFGKPVPTSHTRAHIGNLTLQHRPHAEAYGFGLSWTTDARRVVVIGDLWIFDYGNTPIKVLDPPNPPPPRDITDHHAALLKENLREYGWPPKGFIG